MLTAAMTTALRNLCTLAEQRANAISTPGLEKPGTHLHRV
jgi:hypothetical protein